MQGYKVSANGSGQSYYSKEYWLRFVLHASIHARPLSLGQYLQPADLGRRKAAIFGGL
jgi:hypothetical protein